MCDVVSCIQEGCPRVKCSLLMEPPGIREPMFKDPRARYLNGSQFLSIEKVAAALRDSDTKTDVRPSQWGSAPSLLLEYSSMFQGCCLALVAGHPVFCLVPAA